MGIQKSAVLVISKFEYAHRHTHGPDTPFPTGMHAEIHQGTDLRVFVPKYPKIRNIITTTTTKSHQIGEYQSNQTLFSIENEHITAVSISIKFKQSGIMEKLQI